MGWMRYWERHKQKGDGGGFYFYYSFRVVGRSIVRSLSHTVDRREEDGYEGLNISLFILYSAIESTASRAH